MENKWGGSIKQRVGWWLYWPLSPEQKGKKQKVLPSPPIYPAQKTRWLCTNVKWHKLLLCYVRTVTKRRNKQPPLCTDSTLPETLKDAVKRSADWTWWAPPYFAELVYKWQHPARVHPHTSAISIVMHSVFYCLGTSAGCTVCLLRLSLRGIVSPRLDLRAAHLKSNTMM